MSTDNQAIYWVKEPHNTTVLCLIQDKILMKFFRHCQLFSPFTLSQSKCRDSNP